VPHFFTCCTDLILLCDKYSLITFYRQHSFQGGVPDPLLRFNLNLWTVGLTAVLLTPLATISAANWPRKGE